MKTITVFLFFLMVAFISKAQASYPIPSYGIPVYHIANFTEKNPDKSVKGEYKERRSMWVRTTGGGTPGNVRVIIYSLDGKNVIGPDTLGGTDLKSYEIDGREWGIIIECDEHVQVDVWTEAGKGSPQGHRLQDILFIDNQHMIPKTKLTVYSNTFTLISFGVSYQLLTENGKLFPKIPRSFRQGSSSNFS
jgi:hypothetical protein